MAHLSSSFPIARIIHHSRRRIECEMRSEIQFFSKSQFPSALVLHVALPSQIISLLLTTKESDEFAVCGLLYSFGIPTRRRQRDDLSRSIHFSGLRTSYWSELCQVLR